MDSENPYDPPRDSNGQSGLHYQGATQGKLVWILFSFRGRIPRRVYWGATLGATFAIYGVLLLLALLPSDEPLIASVAAIIFLSHYFLCIWILLAVQVKRWHDRNKSGWWCLVSLIPVIGAAVVFIEAGCLRGTIGPNRFGDDPTDSHDRTSLSQLKDGQATSAKVVELDETAATDEHLSSLVGNTQIEELRLGGTQVTDSGLRELRGLTSLRRLDLSLTRISDDGIDALRSLPKLNTLWLGGTQVSDVGLSRLESLTALREIHAANTNVTSEGVERFKRSRPECEVHL